MIQFSSFFFFSSRRRHTRSLRDWSSDVCSSDLLVDRLRSVRPDLALSTDFIVGFPGESDADFDDTMRLVSEVGFASAFSFKYSRRPGTPGSAMPDQVPEPVKAARLAALQALLAQAALAFNASKV